NAVKYRPTSGATVFSTGTNQWAYALGTTRIDQATYNILSDMGAQPFTPVSTIVLDPAGTNPRPLPAPTPTPTPTPAPTPTPGSQTVASPPTPPLAATRDPAAIGHVVSPNATSPNTTRRRPVTGPSILLGRRTKTRGCRIRDHLPDRACSPGTRFSRVGVRTVCRPGYTAWVRYVPQAKQARVFAAYGIRHHDAATYVVDHIVPLELGGSNAIANLYPQPARPRPGFHDKDALERAAHERVCGGREALRVMQRRIATNWVAQWRRLVG
ncbi:MAG: hypothetical protein JWO02_3453, partial [Solirubrobacterales bacterium]|nr:hypothetical protein [Solirubrobacterales bacterium]